MAMASALRQLSHSTTAVTTPHQNLSSSYQAFGSLVRTLTLHKPRQFSKLNDSISLNNVRPNSRKIGIVSKAAKGSEGVAPADDIEDGVSLGTMKLPGDTDLLRFEGLLFQWANSLCQGANLPLPVPLKVDRIAGGARLGFITIGNGETEVLVYIDCVIFPAPDGSCPVFRAIRNGPMKDQPPPGEPRIMRSLLQALKKSIEIARV